MSLGGWIVVRNWDKFQHYGNREPVWIKNHTRLLHDDAYLGLTAHQRGVLHGLWMMYAVSHRQIAGNTATVSRQLGVRVSRATLEALNRAGFIEFVASKPLALTRSKEVEVEGEKKENTRARTRAKPKPAAAEGRSNVTPADPAAAIRKMVRNGVITDPVDLAAEIAGYKLDDATAERLRGLLQ